MAPTPRPLSRRNLLVRTLGAGAGLMLANPFGQSAAIAAAQGPRRFVFVIQRGAADGLSLLAPVGDPAFAQQRGALAKDFAHTTKLDSTFALHPSLTSTATLFKSKQALFVHAVASPYRERSHFDGQNVLESGGNSPYALKDGWLHRLTSLANGTEGNEIAMASTIPLILRGGSGVMTVSPDGVPQASDDLLAAVGQLYAADPMLAPVWKEALAAQGLFGNDKASKGSAGHELGLATGQLLAPSATGRIAVVETTGWDTHTMQSFRLERQLTHLDNLLAGLREGMGAAWNSTLVVVATEFGRTAHINGSGGTDHGTASLLWMLGGSVAGERVLSDWPGLAPGQLFEGRDLRPTTSMYSVIGTALAHHFGIEPKAAFARLFPETPLKPSKDTFLTV